MPLIMNSEKIELRTKGKVSQKRQGKERKNRGGRLRISGP